MYFDVFKSNYDILDDYRDDIYNYPDIDVTDLEKMIETAEWYKDGKIKEEGTYSYGICISLKKWDADGNIIYEKTCPTEEEMTLIKRRRAMKLRYYSQQEN